MQGHATLAVRSLWRALHYGMHYGRAPALAASGVSVWPMVRVDPIP